MTNEIITKISAFSTVILALITLWYAFLTNQMVNEMHTQGELLNRSYNRSLDAQIDEEYKILGREEFFVVINEGFSTIADLKADMLLFFVSPEHKVFTSEGIKNLLINDKDYFYRAKNAGLIQSPSDISYLLSGSRELKAGDLEPKKETTFEVSSSLSTNAVKLAEALKMKVIARWRMDYKNALDGRSFVNNIYYLLEINGNRQNLKNVLGGTRIITAIKEYEESSTEMIFGFAKDNI